LGALEALGAADGAGAGLDVEVGEGAEDALAFAPKMASLMRENMLMWQSSVMSQINTA